VESRKNWSRRKIVHMPQGLCNLPAFCELIAFRSCKLDRIFVPILLFVSLASTMQPLDLVVWTLSCYEVMTLSCCTWLGRMIFKWLS
jgi:hypothetical protein